VVLIYTAADELQYSSCLRKKGPVIMVRTAAGSPTPDLAQITENFFGHFVTPKGIIGFSP